MSTNDTLVHEPHVSQHVITCLAHMNGAKELRLSAEYEVSIDVDSCRAFRDVQQLTYSLL